ncbi:hypothetical protein DBT_1655 [Dissulfuribacter thermophilus]|uniref:Uncharacterized protein n=1 Tax=Dissulfuribacter thermophilus TaxID=1156395 RepID=A0A1B9F4K3_9BACT|nr:hypothetical protein DBT_1655 [Dissulfuribacter thermophilus]
MYFLLPFAALRDWRFYSGLFYRKEMRSSRALPINRGVLLILKKVR